MKSIFALLSESRPWGSYRRNMTRDEFFSLNRYAALCPELFLTIDICHDLAPDDDMVRQYREWVYLRNIEELSEVDPPQAPPEGVPAWAWYPRLAWLDNRIVPTGELGGKVSDDSDMYQQFTDLPFFENGGVAAKLKDNAMRLAELTDKKHLRDGINILVCDALHAYEEGINHLALMSRWFYGDPVFDRADLAITAREIELAWDNVSGTLHNIGSSNAKGIVVALIDGEGTAISQITIDEIDAPLDLVPKRLDFNIPLPEKPRSAWKLIADPDNTIPEIYEGNNMVRLDDLPAVDYSKGFE